MFARPILKTLAAAVTAALLMTALAGPSLAKPEMGPKAAAHVEHQNKVQAKTERKARHQIRAQARAEAKSAKRQAKAEQKAAKAQAKSEKQAARAERKAQRQAAKLARAEAKELCKDGHWGDWVTADDQAFPNQGQCVAYVVHGGTLTPPVPVLETANSNLAGESGDEADALAASVDAEDRRTAVCHVNGASDPIPTFLPQTDLRMFYLGNLIIVAEKAVAAHTAHGDSADPWLDTGSGVDQYRTDEIGLANVLQSASVDGLKAFENADCFVTRLPSSPTG